MSGTNFCGLFAAAYDVLGIRRKTRFTAPARRLGFLLRDRSSPLSNTLEVLLNLPDYFHDLRGAVRSPPRPLDEHHVN